MLQPQPHDRLLEPYLQPSSLYENLYGSAGGKQIEVAVRVQDRAVRSHARRGDQAVECLANRDAGASSLSVEAGRQCEILKGFEAQDRKLSKVTLHQRNLSLCSQPLKDFGKDNISQAYRRAVLDELDTSSGLRRVLLI